MTDLRATYRLQLGPDLTFADARALVPYLRDLGVSHLYLSPSLTARSGSTHGYDVVDPTTISEALGGEDGLRELAAQEGIGVILDIVPNHMGTGEENRWWKDPEERKRVFDVDPETGFYRRFFDIDDLAAVRQEDPEVFELTHRKTLELLRDGIIDGVRVDHPDGLADPAGYFDRLRDAGAKHVWVEKILHTGEPLRAGWPVDGTVGYEFLNDAQAAFVDRAAEELFTDVWTELTGDGRDFEQHALEAQIELATGTFERELQWLHRLAPQFDTDTLAHALAVLPVYRTYVEPWSGRVDDLDVRYASALPEPLRDVLLLRERGFDEFITRFQQTSPPVTAKGIEDTAFYRYNRLIALNEVGGDPARFGIPIGELHRANAERAEHHPDNLLISSTHDTKRSGDVRARIGALTEQGLRDEWVAFAREYVPRAPDPATGFLVLQTLLGTGPIEDDRLDTFIEKALREAKVHTTWAEPDEEYEARVKAYARSIPTDTPLHRRVEEAGRRSAMGQLLLKLTAPGLPDIYGGDELAYLALVDPDNRRPVDFQKRREALHNPPPKLRLITAALALRKRKPETFARGTYEALDAGDGVCAYVRGDDVLVGIPISPGATPRLPHLRGEWRDVYADDTGLTLRERV